VERAFKLIIFSAAMVALASCAPMHGSSFQSTNGGQNSGDLEGQTLAPRLPLPQQRSEQPIAPQSKPVLTAAPQGSPTVAPAASPTARPSVPARPIETGLPQNKLPIPAWAAHAQSASWTKMTLDAIHEFGDNLLQTEIQDAQDFCPAYQRLSMNAREIVWVQLISSMVNFESGFNPIAFFAENKRGKDGNIVISRGLMQISKGSANDYGCGIQTDVQLEDAKTNLRCGVRILSTLVSKYHAIHGLQEQIILDPNNPWRGGARYWSVLRSKAKDFLIRASVHQLPICHS
jgi:hypothetical protein